MKNTILILAALLATTVFADRTANQGWVKENFVSRTNEWKLAERRHALLILDLNAENAGKWRSFELKASTNNFAQISGGGEAANMVFWGLSDEADGYADSVNPILRDRGQDRMKLFCLSTLTGGDGRAWTKIPTTLELPENTKYLAVLISPDLCFDGRWLGEENEEVVWSYARADASGPERDLNGAVLWHPVQPVRWFHTLPEWAK